MQSSIMIVIQMKLISSALTAFTITLGTMSGASANQKDIYLHLDAPSAETSMDAIKVSFNSELVDAELTERAINERPRLSLTCNDKKLQILHLYLSKDLNPWPSLKENLGTTGEIKSIGSFSSFTGNLVAMSRKEALVITMDIGNSAPDIGRAWYDGMPIMLVIPAKNELPELYISLSGAEPRKHFRTELAAAIKSCEILSGS